MKRPRLDFLDIAGLAAGAAVGAYFVVAGAVSTKDPLVVSLLIALAVCGLAIGFLLARTVRAKIRSQRE